MLAIGSRERSEGNTLCAVIDRINRQIQDINGIYALCCVSIDIYRVVENTAVEVFVTAPLVVVTLADSYFVRVGVRYRSSRFVTYA